MNFIQVGDHYFRFERITEVHDGQRLSGSVMARELSVYYSSASENDGSVLRGAEADSFMEQFLSLAEDKLEKQRKVLS